MVNHSVPNIIKSKQSSKGINKIVQNPRIIKGIYKMKEIPTIFPSRPPLTRARKVMFDTLENFHEMKSVCDLCCGSGSLGLESLSRGANNVTFIDNNYKVIQNLNETIKKWKIPLNPTETNIPYARTFVQDVMELQNITECFDTVFVDLPFPMNQEKTVLQSLLDHNLTNKDSKILVRTLKKEEHNFEGFSVIKRKEVGISAISFLELE